MSRPRAMRVFVSSTFTDMQAERDELVKRVFPALRRRCEQRGVLWSEVDLRWGVTDEQAAEGAVLPICLAEIERSRPFFIGLIGQRYGWVPDEIPSPLAEQLGWLTEDPGRSVTELEILHGVLRAPDDGHAYFYLRDPGWVSALPEAEQGAYREPTADGARRLDELRARVAASGRPAAAYASPADLADRVRADFEALIDALFPADEAVDEAERIDAVHRAFGRARFGLHVPRPELEASIAAAMTGPPILVTGASGAGASSAALAVVPDDALVHHVGADADAADFRQIAARIVARLGEPFDRDRFLGASAAEVAAGIAAAGAGRHAVILLDDADDLADVDRAPDLRWLPADLGTGPLAGVRVIVTGSGERTRAAFAHRGWGTVTVPDLTEAERRDLTRAVLRVSAKALSGADTEALVAAPGTGNARFLRTALEELRQHGDHFTLRRRIDELAGAATVEALFELVLARWERDYDRDRPGLVRDAMTALWAAHDGLGEAELLELLSPADGHLPSRQWSPLALAAEHCIHDRDGLLGFVHPDIRAAVERRYLGSPEAERAAHAALTSYFRRQPLGPRQADELGWQLAGAGDLDGLRQLLSDTAWVELAYARNTYDLRRLWSLLGPLPELGTQMAGAYASVIADPAAAGDLAWGVARLLADAGAVEAARPIMEHFASTSTGAARVGALINLGALRLATGDPAAAADAFEQAAALSAGGLPADEELRADALGDLAIAQRDLGRWAEAEANFSQSDAIRRRLGLWHDVQANLSGWMELSRRTGAPRRALAQAEEQERICRELADPVAVGRALAARAVVLGDLGRAAEAVPLLEEYAAIAAAEGDLRGFVENTINLSSMLMGLRQLERAVALLRSGAPAVAALADPQLALAFDTNLQLALGEHALALLAGGRLDEAWALMDEQESICRRIGHDVGLAAAVGNKAIVVRHRGDIAGALALVDEQLAIASRSGDAQGMLFATANRGELLGLLGRIPEALAALRSARALAAPSPPMVAQLDQMISALTN